MENRQIFKTFTKYSLSNVLGMMGFSIYILADTFFVARGLGTHGLASLNIAIPSYSFMRGIGLMVGMGGATRYSILKQNKDIKQIDDIFSQSMKFTLLLSIPFFFMGLFLSDQLATLMGANEVICDMTSTYLKIICLFSPTFMLEGTLLSFVRNDDNPRLAMASMLAGSFSDILLDYIFIFPLKMGIAGAALASGIAPIIAILILLLHFVTKRNNFKFVNVKLKFETIKDTISLGAGTLITQLSAGIVIMLFNIVIMKILGNIGVAAYGIIANIAVVVNAIFTGISDGVQPIISSSYGKADKKSITKTYRYALITSIVFAVVIYILTYIFAHPVVELFNKDHNVELTKIAVEGIRLYFIAFLFIGTNILTAIYFSSTDKPKQAFIISILRGLVLIVPVTLLMSHFFGMYGVWLSLTISEFLTMIVAITFYIKQKAKDQCKQPTLKNG